MSDFLTTYELTRGRFDDAVSKLNHAQLNYRLTADSLTTAEMALHVAGVEIWFAAQLHGQELSGEDKKLADCATEGSINDSPFPYTVDEMTPEVVAAGLARGRAAAMSVFESSDPEIRTKSLKSALGPMINGEGAMVRLAAHPFYHQGQIHMITSSSEYPK